MPQNKIGLVRPSLRNRIPSVDTDEDLKTFSELLGEIEFIEIERGIHAPVLEWTDNSVHIAPINGLSIYIRRRRINEKMILHYSFMQYAYSPITKLEIIDYKQLSYEETIYRSFLDCQTPIASLVEFMKMGGQMVDSNFSSRIEFSYIYEGRLHSTESKEYNYGSVLRNKNPLFTYVTTKQDVSDVISDLVKKERGYMLLRKYESYHKFLKNLLIDKPLYW